MVHRAVAVADFVARAGDVGAMDVVRGSAGGRPWARKDANADESVHPVPWVFGVLTRADGSSTIRSSSAL